MLSTCKALNSVLNHCPSYVIPRHFSPGWVGREGRDTITSQDFTHKGDSLCVGLHQVDKKVRLDFKARELRRSSSAS